MALESSGTVGAHPHRLGTCPKPGTSAGGSAGICCGCFGRWDSSAAGYRSRPHYIAGSGGRNPGEERPFMATHAELKVVPRTSNPHALVSELPTPGKLPKSQNLHHIIVTDPVVTFPHQDQVLFLPPVHDPRDHETETKCVSAGKCLQLTLHPSQVITP